VLGLGLIGQIVILLARHQRVDQILAADVSPTLRRKAEWSGATRIIPLPAESVVDAVGQQGRGGVHAAVVLTSDPTLLPQAFSALRPGGALVLASPFSPSVRMEVPPAHIRHHEIRLQGVQRFEERDVGEARRTIQQGIVNGEALVSKRIAWKDLGNTILGDDYWTHGTHVVVKGPEWDGPSLPGGTPCARAERPPSK
jgi:threonine dehydrogenase-like Zn-dependent dehydrogenase